MTESENHAKASPDAGNAYKLSKFAKNYAASTDLTETQIIDNNPTKAAARTSKMRSRKMFRVSCTLARISAKVTPRSIEICQRFG